MTKAAESAYRQAEITDPQEEIDLVEVDDTFAYRELLHLEALGLGEASGSRSWSRRASSSRVATSR